MNMNWYDRIARAAGDDVAWWIMFLAIGGAGASMLSLSVVLRSGSALTLRAVAGAMLHSMVWAVVVFLMAYSTLKQDLPMLLGLSILSGLGSASVADILLMLVKNRLGITINLNPPKKE